MDYGNQITKDTIRELLDRLPDSPMNDQIRRAMLNLLTARNIQPIPYTYLANLSAAGAANALAAGAVNTPVNVNIQADADFLVLNQTYDANSLNAARTSGTVVVPNATVLITDTGSGYQMMDQAVPIGTIFGTGEFPYILPEPKLLPAKATLQLLFSNYDAAAGYNLRLAFNGVKLFKYN